MKNVTPLTEGPRLQPAQKVFETWGPGLFLFGLIILVPIVIGGSVTGLVVGVKKAPARNSFST